ncbi:MAG TPA: M42 family metallopeptidase [Haliscomenobacter sp.]|uniref:M42 family metallopeptidase n=1 Tax=Haliscomenobacter sp. TaxID=2717303 RepID=UPI001D94BBE6|nr:M42 family metallopeptidase [Haliscomenobacter sp.]MBK9487742.1 M42 family metallopeptidase [Haliscomenobacter sp.]HOY17758.1 M42 family metallopeptidase [Haliscomenobacter sp.]HPH20847.1 M42 family metallopeptidase [Haliscomenobacter sp.]
MINLQLLKRICETPGAPGFEQRIRQLVIKEVQGLVDELSVDNMGNVVAIKRGKERKRAMIAAHLDEIGFIVNHIDEEGFLFFHPLGGFDPKTLTSQRVIVHGKKDVIGVMGSKPIHLMKPEERNKVVPMTDYYIDLGMRKEEVIKIVSIGDPVTRERELIEMGDCVNSKSLDNRVSVFILIETLRALQGVEIPYDIYGVFTVQEEVGLRGAISAAHGINPDFGFGLDVTIAFDTPGAQAQEAVTKLGKGAGIKILDGSVISDYRMVRYLKETADQFNIPWQPEILPAGGTDTAGVQRYGKKGAIAGAISIPLRHIHQTIEMANKADIQHCTDLLIVALQHLHEFNWEFR